MRLSKKPDLSGFFDLSGLSGFSVFSGFFTFLTFLDFLTKAKFSEYLKFIVFELILNVVILVNFFTRCDMQRTADLDGIDRVIGTIKIIGVPNGEAPRHIREAWVGVTLPAREVEPLMLGKPEEVISRTEVKSDEEFYFALTNDALDTLFRNGKDSLHFWWAKVLRAHDYLLFEKGVCEFTPK